MRATALKNSIMSLLSQDGQAFQSQNLIKFVVFETWPTNAGQLTRAAVELAKLWRTDKYLRNLDVIPSNHSFISLVNSFIIDVHISRPRSQRMQPEPSLSRSAHANILLGDYVCSLITARILSFEIHVSHSFCLAKCTDITNIHSFCIQSATHLDGLQTLLQINVV